MTQKTRGRGRPMVDSSLDVWHGVRDARERKKIQDRLAQRARRQRLQRQQCDSAPQTEKSSSPVTSEARGAPASKTIDQEEGPLEADEHQVIPIPPSMPQFINYEHMRLPKFAWTLCAALAHHGLMQSTDCQSCMVDIPSPAEYLLLPPALRPTALQLAVKHRNWIDRFPFPRLRDNLILLADRIDLSAFVYDLFNMPSLTLRENGERCTWNPSSWRLERGFARKWGHLFLSQARLFASGAHIIAGDDGEPVMLESP